MCGIIGYIGEEEKATNMILEGLSKLEYRGYDSAGDVYKRQYRGGQRTMAAYVYKTIQDGGGLFLQAPTGIGKTISALFPALKAMGEGLTSKLFYLTAKSATALAAQEAIERLRTQTREQMCIRDSGYDEEGGLDSG